MKKLNKYVGLDVHKDTTVVAVAESGREGEVRIYGMISSDLHALERVLGKLGGEDVTLHVVYEAGPTGYVLYRRLQQLKIDCMVVAPTKTPQQKGFVKKPIGGMPSNWPGCTGQVNSGRFTFRMRWMNRSAI